MRFVWRAPSREFWWGVGGMVAGTALALASSWAAWAMTDPPVRLGEPQRPISAPAGMEEVSEACQRRHTALANYERLMRAGMAELDPPTEAAAESWGWGPVRGDGCAVDVIVDAWAPSDTENREALRQWLVVCPTAGGYRTLSAPDTSPEDLYDECTGGRGRNI